MIFLFPEQILAQTEKAGPIKFRKQFIAAESFESVGVFDVNGDKVPDLVSGNFWYEGPEYLKRHHITDVKRHGEYYDDFATIPMDLNGDGRLDFVTGGWFSETLRWHENQGAGKPWTDHNIAKTGNIETIRAWDVDGDGSLELVPNTPGKPLAFYKVKAGTSTTPEFTRVEVAKTHGHGLGFGDVNGDGRGDFIISNGWLEAPANPFTGSWKLHSEFSIEPASVPIIVTDVNKDGLSDLISGNGHGYGLSWYEQKLDKRGKRSWVTHPIDADNSQFHEMQWVDLNNDGKQELVTGKRYRAHNGNDPGANDDFGLYYYSWNGDSFTKNVISYGSLGEGVGTGIYFSVADLRGTGRPDIIVAGKQGLYVFYNEG
ncbi:FG-GAP repeat domain-containing protein [Pontibacter toksunensis]|uniref:FG-GAP repeat domain-containing protein n=1 Tax=Pontibacter toksunensis TaxID=1332631 RepID=A0ABW6BX88_9BACT